MAIEMTAFWQEIGEQMGIWEDDRETDLPFCCRVILSALSSWMLTTVGGADQSVSIVRLQQMIKEKLAGYLLLLPMDIQINSEEIAETIYNLLLENGAFYHFQYNVRPAPRKLIGCGDVSLIRGMIPEEKAYFSGFAPFAMESLAEETLTEDFMLWPLDGPATIDLVWKRSIPVDSSVNPDEYLNIERTSGRYFTGRRNPDWPFTLARKREFGLICGYEYYIFMEKEVRRISIEYQQASVHEYVRLAMMNRIRKQVVNARIGKHIVLIEFGYLLPAPDLRFMKFISWPVDMVNMRDDFRFMLHPAVWPAIRNRLLSLGYEVHENHD